MTLRRCQYGNKLPTNVSCVVLCQDFPDCLPPPSPELATALRQFVTEASQERDQTEATTYTLSCLRDALNKGIRKKAK
jgi:hypothetical protein